MIRDIAALKAVPTPLCPAGHLPLKGGDQTIVRLSPISNDARLATGMKLPISPLEGEMSGRTEGGRNKRKPLATVECLP